MGRFANVPAASALVILLLASTSSCGQSQNIGWANREPPDRSRADTAPLASQQAEFQRLAALLGPLLNRAMEDEALAARWERVMAAVDSEVAKKDDLNRKLIDRQNEIRAQLEADEMSGGAMSDEERATLITHFQNIQSRLASDRNIVMAHPTYSRELESLQVALYEQMRELEPMRTAEIDRMERLGRQLFEALDSVMGPSGD